jgi:predicted TIM-barrel fold metal-dependent hydrolase
MMQPTQAKPLRTITLEEHFVTPRFLAGPGRQFDNQSPLSQSLKDLDARRIADMDAAGIDMQVLSLTSPGVEQLEADEAVSLAQETNDFLAEAVRRHPSRFAGFAALPTAAPERAANELERAVHDLGFKGALINGHARGRYLDDPFFWPILERAEALAVPIYLHPTPPPQPVIQASYTGHFAPEVTAILATSGWGWHIETATHVLRMILGGVFDRFPRFQVIIGHLGETLPFMIPRLDQRLPPVATKLDRPLGAYMRENLHYTFGGFNYLPTFMDLWMEVGSSRIMFSADYPFAAMAEARTFLERLPISPAEKAQIAHGNAERLLRI